jgi:hypothetical protein
MGLLASVALADSGVRIQGSFGADYAPGKASKVGAVTQKNMSTSKGHNKRPLPIPDDKSHPVRSQDANSSSTNIYRVGDSGNPARPFKCMVAGCAYTATRRRCASSMCRHLRLFASTDASSEEYPDAVGGYMHLELATDP